MLRISLRAVVLRATALGQSMRAGTLPLAVAVLFILTNGSSRAIWAQPAHFAGAQSVVTNNLVAPRGIAVDLLGNVYVADTNGQRVLKESPTARGYAESTFVDAATSGVSYFVPTWVATDGLGDVFVLSGADGQVLKFSPTRQGYVETFIPLPESFLGVPYSMAADPWGNVYLSFVHATGSVLKWSPTANGYAGTSIGNNLGPFDVGIAADLNQNVYVSSLDGTVYKETRTNHGYAQSVVASGYGLVTDVAVDPLGTVYVGDASYSDAAVWKETPTPNGYVMSRAPGTGFEYPMGIAVDLWDDLYVSDNDKGRVTVLRPLGGTFPAVEVGNTSDSPITMIFTFDRAGTLGATAVTTLGGGAGPEFVDAGTGTCQGGATYAAGAFCSVDVTFAPRIAGLRLGAVALLNGQGKTMATGYMIGQGVR